MDQPSESGYKSCVSLSDLNIALVSMPWRRPNNAAIGLASLKAAALDAGVRECDVLYLNDRWFQYLFKNGLFSDELKRARYSEFARVISELAGVIQAGEWMFSNVVFDGYQCAPNEYMGVFCRVARGNEYGRFARDFIANSNLASDFIEECIEGVEWDKYDVIGLSCVFYQLVPSLALAKRLREVGYSGKILLGGPLCEGVVGEKILTLFPYIDAVFDGESEISFPEYLRQITNRLVGPLAPGVWQRTSGGVVKSDASSAVREMDLLPTPNYSDFFEELESQGLVSRKEVAFPLEASRGCWWGQHHHCIFCGLNGSDMTYRAKSPARIYEEIKSIHLTHGIEHFAFTDNIVSPKFMQPLIRMLEASPLPVTFHAEIKANLSRERVKEYRRAGFIYLQPGIESLSSRVLKIMDKGISALANVACLKYCREAGITPFWNLLHGFPGENQADYEQTLRFLSAITHLQPPEAVTAMRLTRFSPSFDKSEELGFHGKRPAQFYKLIYPYLEEVLGGLVNSFEFEFNDGLDRDVLLRPIEKFITKWKSQSYVGTLVIDKAKFRTVIYDSRFSRVRDFRVLSTLEEMLYRSCDAPQNAQTLTKLARDNFPDATDGEVAKILEGFVADLMMLEEDGSFLSLAVYDSEFIPWQAIATADQVSQLVSEKEPGIA